MSKARCDKLGVISCLLEDKGYGYDWTHIIGCVGHQVVFQAAAAICISEGRTEKEQKEKKQTEISLCKEIADGRKLRR